MGNAIMSLAFFLSPDELEILTGYKLPMRQVSWLRTKGWRFELNGNRKPIIARRYAEKMLGCDDPDREQSCPNFAALRAA